MQAVQHHEGTGGRLPIVCINVRQKAWHGEDAHASAGDQ